MSLENPTVKKLENQGIDIKEISNEERDALIEKNGLVFVMPKKNITRTMEKNISGADNEQNSLVFLWYKKDGKIYTENIRMDNHSVEENAKNGMLFHM